MKIDGTRVSDARKPMALRITKRDCRIGSVKDPATCAAARALCRNPVIEECRVHLSRVYVKIGKRWVRYMAPPALRTEIISFDRGGKFEPGRYILTPLQPTARIGARKQSPDRRTGTRPQKRIKYHVVHGVRTNANEGTERGAYKVGR